MAKTTDKPVKKTHHNIVSHCVRAHCIIVLCHIVCGDVLVGLRTEFLFGVPCRAACNTKCVSLCVCMFVCVCVCVCVCKFAQGEGRDLHLPNEGGP